MTPATNNPGERTSEMKKRWISIFVPWGYRLTSKIIFLTTALTVFVTALFIVYEWIDDAKDFNILIDKQNKIVIAAISEAVINPIIGDDYPELLTLSESLLTMSDEILHLKITPSNGTLPIDLTQEQYAKKMSAHTQMETDIKKHEEFRVYEKEILLDENSLGTVTMMVSTKNFDVLLMEHIIDLVIISVLFFMAKTLGLVYVIRKIITEPLDKLVVYCIKLGQKDLTSPIVLDSRDELAFLAKTLDKTRKDLEDHQLNLEKKIAEKTVQLLDKIEEQKETVAQLEIARSKLAKEATTDGLTQLPNKTDFENHLAMAISFSVRFKRKMVVFFIDLDKFKPINDSLGHDIGDQFLKEVGKILRSVFKREIEIAARIGGDEFGAILPEIEHEKEATDLASILLTEFNKEFNLNGYTVRIEASIGIAIGIGDKRILKKADTAMYRAKDEGGNMYVVFAEKTHKE